LQDRREGLWWGSHLASLALHAAAVAWVVQTGVIVVQYTQRFGYGYQFGQAVLLASPLFELGERSPLRGRERNIPLSALVPQEKLRAPDLRKLLEASRVEPARSGQGSAAEARRAYGEENAAALSIPFSGGGGALPAGSLPERVGTGAATPFDLVPPSNTRERRGGSERLVLVRAGDAAVPGGGAREGLRLPASPARVGIAVEATLDAAAAAEMEEWLRVLLGRLRRTSFELLPDRRDAGAPGMAVLRAEADRTGRFVKREVASSSGNAALDRLALALLDAVPAWHPLPGAVSVERVVVTVRVRYFPRQ
jgi:TonB family protein